MTRINIEVEEETYERWKSHADEDDRYTTFSHFVTRAINNQYGWDRQFDSDFRAVLREDVGGFQGSSGDIVDEINDLKKTVNTTIQSLQNDIARIQVMAEGTDDESFLSDMMTTMHDLVVRTTPEEIEAGEVSGTKVEEIIQEAQNRGEISRDVNEADVRKALAQLENDVPSIKTTTVNGERHYYELE